MKKLTLALILVTFITACTSLVEKGDKLFESGQFNDAASFYERALAKDPDNIEAKLGLNRARYKIIDRGLIEVRMMRLSSNYTAAAQKLEQILRNQMQWHLELDSAITATQAEETRYAVNWLLKEADTLVKNSRYPDKFRWLNYSYGQLIANGRLQAKLQQYHDVIWQKGANQCQELSNTVKDQRFFLRDFTHQYCQAWDRQVSLDTDQYDKSRYTRLNAIANIRVRGARNNQKETILAHIENLKNQFTESPWHSSLGNATLDVDIAADLYYTHVIHQEARRAPYTVDKTETVRNADGQQVTKTTELQRYHPYYAFVHREQIKLNISYTSMVNKEKVWRSANEEKSNLSEAHTENFAAANLSPTKPNLFDVTGFLDDTISDLNHQYYSALDKLWETSYCPQAVNDSSGETVLRCARVNPNDASVNNWFTQKFGLNHQQFDELYGIQ